MYSNVGGKETMSFQDHLFVYHAPNERTSPRYAAVRAAATALEETLVRVQAAYGEQAQPAALYAQINAAAAAFFETFGSAPVVDRVLFDAATVALTLARNAANEAVAEPGDLGWLDGAGQPRVAVVGVGDVGG